MTRYIQSILLFVLLLQPNLVYAQSDQGKITFTVINHSESEDICSVEFQRATRLVNCADCMFTDNISTGQSAKYQLAPDIYDFDIYMCGNNTQNVDVYLGKVDLNRPLTIHVLGDHTAMFAYDTPLPVPTRIPQISSTQPDLQIETDNNNAPVDTGLEVINKTTNDICYVFASEVNASSWNNDRLVPIQILGLDQRAAFNLPPGDYDVLLVNCSNQLLGSALKTSINAGNVTSLIYPIDFTGDMWNRTIEIQNRSNHTICNVLLIPLINVELLGYSFASSQFPVATELGERGRYQFARNVELMPDTHILPGQSREILNIVDLPFRLRLMGCDGTILYEENNSQRSNYQLVYSGNSSVHPTSPLVLDINNDTNDACLVSTSNFGNDDAIGNYNGANIAPNSRLQYPVRHGVFLLETCLGGYIIVAENDISVNIKGSQTDKSANIYFVGIEPIGVASRPHLIGTGLALMDIGNHYSKRGDFELAEQIFRASVSYFRNRISGLSFDEWYVGDDPPLTSMLYALNELGNTYRYRGLQIQAQAYYQQVLDFLQLLPAIAYELEEGSAAQYFGQKEIAFDFVMSELFSNPDHTIMLRRDQPYLAGPYAATLNNMGLSLLAQGRSAQAFNAFNRVRLLSTFAQTTQPSEIEAWDMNGRFTLPEPEFFPQNDPTQYLPEDFFHEDIFDSNLTPNNYSDGINQILQQTSVPFLSDDEWKNIFRDVYFEPISTSPQYTVTADTAPVPSVYNFLTDYRDAQTRSLINLGEWYNMQQGDLAPLRAANLLAQAYQNTNNKTPPSDMAMLYAQLGRAFAKTGEVEKAKILYRRSLSLYFQIQDIVGIATVFTDLAQVYTDSGDSDDALQYYEIALSILSQTNLPTQETEARFGYAYALSLNDKFLEAIEEYRIGIQIFEDQITNAAVDTAIAETIDRREANSPYHNIAELLVKHVKTTEAIAEALLFIEKGNAILARTELAEKPSPIRLELGGLDKRLLIQRQDMLYLVWRSGILLAIIRDLEVKKALYNDAAAKEDLQERYARSGSPHSEPEASRSYALAQLEFTEINNLMAIKQGLITRQIAAVPSVKTIQDTIPLDTTLLVYSIGQKESLAFIITTKTINVSILDVTHRQLSDFSAERSSHPIDLLSTPPIYAKLYSALLAPINNLIQTPNLAIVPDKELAYMPFAAFELPDGRKLIDEHITWNLHSLSSFVLLANRSYSENAATAGLILGNTQAVIDPSGPLPEIGYVKEEVEAIAKQLGVAPLLDNSATELTFRRQAGSSEIIHVSAHGILDPEFPSFSSLALAYNSSEMTISDMYDGNLWAEEVYALDLTHGTQLVVLSGCDTASGGNGEDFGVLTRAFLVAGSPRVMASLWKVPDHEATVLLMQKFYEYRSIVANDAIALKEAMLSVRQLYPNPFYWAGFTLYGVLGTEVANQYAFTSDDSNRNEEFAPLTFCTENDFDFAKQVCTTSETVFTGIVKSVHLSWDPPNQYHGKLFKRVWYLDGNQFLVNENYSSYAYIEVATRNSLKPGKYLVELFVEEKLVQSGSFEIQ